MSLNKVRTNIAFILVLFASTLFMSCDNVVQSRYENETSVTIHVTVYFDGRVPVIGSNTGGGGDVLNILPNETGSVAGLFMPAERANPNEEFTIVGTNIDGDVLFSEVFTWQELNDMDWFVEIVDQR